MVSLTVHVTSVESKNPPITNVPVTIKNFFNEYEKYIEKDGLLDILTLGIKWVPSSFHPVWQ